MIFIVDYHAHRAKPAIRPLSAAEAAARLYVTMLNPLAHPEHGLDAVVAIAAKVPVFALEAAELGATCQAIRDVVSRTELANAFP